MAIGISDVLSHFDKHVDIIGWVKKWVTPSDRYSFEVDVEFKEGDPRRWILVSKDAFRTLDNVAIYEVDQSPWMGDGAGGPWYRRFWRKSVSSRPEVK